MPSRSDAAHVPRRRLAPEARRSELLDAAMDQLRAHGSNCTVASITDAAGTAKGNFYRYFESWDALLDAARERVMSDYRRGMDDRIAADPGADWWTVLEREVEQYIDEQLDLGPLHELLFHRVGASSLDDGAPEIIQGFIALGVADGTFRPVDGATLGRLLFHTLHGAADDIAAGVDRDATVAGVLEIVRSVLQP
ncbi:MAG: TetR/AcrR family transcriptional regulator [Actinomycetota bacterium]